MKINLAHIHEQGIDFVVFEADATSHQLADRERLLAELVGHARDNRLKVDKAALAFMECGKLTFFGTPDLVRFLSNRRLPGWTHQLDV